MFVSINNVRSIGLALVEGSLTTVGFNAFFNKDTAPSDTTPQDVNVASDESSVAPVMESPVVAEDKPAVEDEPAQLTPRKLFVRIKQHVKREPEVTIEEACNPEEVEDVTEPEQVIEDRPLEPIIVNPNPAKRFSLKLSAPIFSDPGDDE